MLRRMKPNHNMMKFATLLLLLFACCFTAHSQATLPITRGIKLDSIFPVDDIISVKVRNNYGEHTLTVNELAKLKTLLKQATSAGGLVIKPGHIILSVKLKNNSIAKPGLAYASTGSVHFDGATSRNGQIFSNTFKLPAQLNFDNYR